MRFDSVAAATGRWPGLLGLFGVNIEHEGIHGICPICGKKKFRFDDKDGKGTWICVCGAGDGFKLLNIVKGWEFKESCQEIKKAVSLGVPLKCDLNEKPVKTTEDTRKDLNAQIKASCPAKIGGPVSVYLRNRGIEILPGTIWENLNCYESQTKTRMAAMICRFSGADGKPVTIHRTYLQDGKKAKIDSPKKVMTAAGKKDGGAIRIFEHKGTLGIAEGIETALACYQLFNIPTWAAMDAGYLEKFEPPKNVDKLLIFGDNDTSFTGQKAAYSLARKLAIRSGITVEVRLPEMVGDWLDELNRKRRSAGAMTTPTPGYCSRTIKKGTLPAPGIEER
jgi:putative DNA primase/helicase